jgi:hypothetical protein
MNSLITKTFTAQAAIGLHKGYSTELITIQEFKNALYIAQQKTKEQFSDMLSTKITLCEIVFLGQEEPSITLDFIQYPKFLIEEEKLKQVILFLVEQLMLALKQNRVVIIFPTETIMLEQSNEIDPRITL